MGIVALTILIVFCIAGFAAIFFTTFGTFIILLGTVIYSAMTGFSIIGVKPLILLAILYFIGELLEYVFVITGAKKFGASNAAIAGAIIGGSLGGVIGAAFFGIGIFLGIFAGIFAGAFVVEYIIHGDVLRSFKAGTGGIVGRLGSIASKVVIAFFMYAILAHNIIHNIRG